MIECKAGAIDRAGFFSCIQSGVARKRNLVAALFGRLLVFAGLEWRQRFHFHLLGAVLEENSVVRIVALPELAISDGASTEPPLNKHCPQIGVISDK